MPWKQEILSKNEKKEYMSRGVRVLFPMVSLDLGQMAVEKIFVTVGQSVVTNELMIMFEGEKAAVELRSEFSGRIVSILVHEKAPVAEGDELLIINKHD